MWIILILQTNINDYNPKNYPDEDCRSKRGRVHFIKRTNRYDKDRQVRYHPEDAKKSLTAASPLATNGVGTWMGGGRGLRAQRSHTTSLPKNKTYVHSKWRQKFFPSSFLNRLSRLLNVYIYCWHFTYKCKICNISTRNATIYNLILS